MIRKNRGGDFHLLRACGFPRAWIIAIVYILGITPAISAREIAYRDPNGTWRVIEESKWPRVLKTAPNAQKYVSPIVGKTTFEVTYVDVANQSGVGFDDPSLGATRRATVDSVLSYISSVLNKTGACQIEFLASETDAGGALASGGPFFFTDGPYEQPLSLKHIVTGTDPAPNNPDITVTVDFGWQWHSGTDTNPGGQYDLYSVLLHEITHGLGLISLATASGSSAISPNVFSTWDDFLYTGGGVKLWNSSGIFAGNTSYMTGGDGGLFFRGAKATAEYGSFPGIYAPAVYSSGSSIGHWNVGTAGPPVMLHSIKAGDMIRAYALFEIQALSDIGYDIVLPVSSVGDWELYN